MLRQSGDFCRAASPTTTAAAAPTGAAARTGTRSALTTPPPTSPRPALRPAPTTTRRSPAPRSARRRCSRSPRAAGTKTRLFAMPLCTQNPIVSPRRARDKHRASTQKERNTRFLAARRRIRPSLFPSSCAGSARRRGRLVSWSRPPNVRLRWNCARATAGRGSVRTSVLVSGRAVELFHFRASSLSAFLSRQAPQHT
jgi:hypothetical protein